MKYTLIASLAAVLFAASTLAQTPSSREAEIRAFHTEFLAAVRANNKEKIADLIAFPVDDWSIERNHNVTQGSIKDRTDFLARYNSLFSPFMRLHVPKAKLEALQDGRYALTWDDADSEFTFEIELVDGKYRIRAYDIGAR